MVYIQEVLFRFFYLSLTIVLTFFINFWFKEYTLLFFLSPLLQSKQLKDTAFLFNSPYDLFDIYYQICVFGTLIIVLPIVLHQVSQFLISGLSVAESKNLQIKKLKIIFFFYIFNSCLIIFFLPLFWQELELFNVEILYFSYLNVEYEPNLQKYILFLFKTTFLFNIFFIFQHFYVYLIKNQDIKKYLALLQYEKTVVFFLVFFLISITAELFQGLFICVFFLFYFVIFNTTIKIKLLLKYKKQKQK